MEWEELSIMEQHCECVQWHLTMYCTSRHIKSHGNVSYPRVRPQAHVAGLNVVRQNICYFRVTVGIAIVECWNVDPSGSVLTVTDEI